MKRDDSEQGNTVETSDDTGEHPASNEKPRAELNEEKLREVETDEGRVDIEDMIV